MGFAFLMYGKSMNLAANGMMDLLNMFRCVPIFNFVAAAFTGRFFISDTAVAVF